MKELKTLEEVGEVWNNADSICEVVQAIVNQSKYVQILSMEIDGKNLFLVEVDAYETPGVLIDQDDVLDGAKFERGILVDTLAEAITYFNGVVKPE